MQRFYRAADGVPTRLPWHRSEPPEILRSAVGEIEAGAMTLDIACGAVPWLSERGLRVTGLDLLSEAIAMA
jgi:2-polyprenyl-3-methyl-5-hydroxy-6-metoxy-1,4-benzoquinol methylase